MSRVHEAGWHVFEMMAYKQLWAWGLKGFCWINLEDSITPYFLPVWVTMNPYLSSLASDPILPFWGHLLSVLKRRPWLPGALLCECVGGHGKQTQSGWRKTNNTSFVNRDHTWSQAPCRQLLLIISFVLKALPRRYAIIPTWQRAPSLWETKSLAQCSNPGLPESEPILLPLLLINPRASEEDSLKRWT